MFRRIREAKYVSTRLLNLPKTLELLDAQDRKSKQKVFQSLTRRLLLNAVPGGEN